jgi:hypothetical protein
LEISHFETKNSTSFPPHGLAALSVPGPLQYKLHDYTQTHHNR